MRKETANALQAAPTDATGLLMREVGFAPVLSSDPSGWKDVQLRKWEGAGTTVRYPAFGEVVLVLQSGAGHWKARCEGRWLDRESVRGQITVIPPGTPVDWRVAANNIDGWTLHLPARCFDGLSDDSPGDRLMRRVQFDFASSDSLLQATVGSLVSELQRPLGYGPQYVSALADTIKLHLLRGSGGATADVSTMPRTVLRRVLERIEASLEHGVTVDELARLTGRGRSQFTASFRAATGCSPLQYLRRRRIDQAKQKLARGNESLAEIALALGFASQAHFSTCFREAVGTTPSQYRASAH